MEAERGGHHTPMSLEGDAVGAVRCHGTPGGRCRCERSGWGADPGQEASGE